MKPFLMLMLLWMGAGVTARAQSAVDLNEGLQLVKDGGTGIFTLSWWGKSGRTYFIQTSPDMLTWSYLPFVETGVADVSGIQFTNTGERQFWRLRFTDAATGGNAETADFDGDGLGNLFEVENGLDPLSADSDGDGVGDADEVDFNLNKTGNDMAQNAATLQYNDVNRLVQKVESGVTHAVQYDREGNITELQ
jgi:hypothetical protein